MYCQRGRAACRFFCRWLFINLDSSLLEQELASPSLRRADFNSFSSDSDSSLYNSLSLRSAAALMSSGLKLQSAAMGLLNLSTRLKTRRSVLGSSSLLIGLCCVVGCGLYFDGSPRCFNSLSTYSVRRQQQHSVSIAAEGVLCCCWFSRCYSPLRGLSRLGSYGDRAVESDDQMTLNHSLISLLPFFR